jgi:membrane fusion protein (multidrug efflux system)
MMSRRVSWILWVVAAVLVAVIGVLAWRVATRKPPKGDLGEARRSVVRVWAAEPRDVVETLILAGRVEAVRDARLGAAKGGLVVELAVREGDRVSAGDLLVRLDDRTWSAMAARAATDRDDAARQLQRVEALFDEGAVSSNELDAARTRLAMAAAAQREASAHVAQCRIEAPFDGIVDERGVEVGDFVPEGGTVFRLVDIQAVKIGFDVPERDISNVATGQLVTFSVSAIDGAGMTGRVTFVASAATGQAGTYRVDLALDNPGERLKPGMLADVALERGLLHDRIVVPLEAVLPARGEHVVFVVLNEHAVRRVVRLAAIVGEDAVLETGVDPGDAVVIEGQRTLADGASVILDDEAGGAGKHFAEDPE